MTQNSIDTLDQAGSDTSLTAICMTPGESGVISASAQAVIDRLGDLAKQANHGCGLIYEIYVDKVSDLVDAEIVGLSADDKVAVRAVARQVVGYATQQERAATAAAWYEDGYCSHGLTEDTCPCGCFEDDEPYDYYDGPDDYGTQELSWQTKINMMYIKARIETCDKVIAALTPLAEECEEAAQHLVRVQKDQSELVFELYAYYPPEHSLQSTGQIGKSCT